MSIRALEAVEDHVHLLLDLQGNQSLSVVMHDLKGASAREVLRLFPDLRIDLAASSLWQKGYGWRLVPEGQTEAVRRYIETQETRPLRHE